MAHIVIIDSLSNQVWRFVFKSFVPFNIASRLFGTDPPHKKGKKKHMSVQIIQKCMEMEDDQTHVQATINVRLLTRATLVSSLMAESCCSYRKKPPKHSPD